MYFTFDDGPSEHTEEILDILDAYDVKATFFVIGNEDGKYDKQYKEICKRGHTLGMHSFSHKYDVIYASNEAFWDDLNKLQNFLYKKTGVWSHFYRFPGGSSNMVSQIDMEDLANQLLEQDIYYLDWNVSGLDATGKKISAEKMAKTVISEVEKHSTSVVLLHDAYQKEETVKALPMMIEGIQELGPVSFLAVSDEMQMVQHISNIGEKKQD